MPYTLLKMKDYFPCPHCGKPAFRYRNPFPTVDIIIEVNSVSQGADNKLNSAWENPDKSLNETGIVLIRRKNPPYGWALPGGFVDYGESLETAATREAFEETSLKVTLLFQLGAYSDPKRDPRHHSISVVFVARAAGLPVAADDAAEVGVFTKDTLPEKMVFDHGQILKDYFEKCRKKD